jgi:hypothetical protein
MKAHIFLLALVLSATLGAADLPTINVEHMYYLAARAERIHKLNPDEMIEYCITQKIGGTPFENLYAQVFATRIELTKLLKIEEVPVTDPRVIALGKTRDAYTALLREEARRVQNGIAYEGQVATDALKAIARAQNLR